MRCDHRAGAAVPAPYGRTARADTVRTLRRCTFDATRSREVERASTVCTRRRWVRRGQTCSGALRGTIESSEARTDATARSDSEYELRARSGSHVARVTFRRPSERLRRPRARVAVGRRLSISRARALSSVAAMPAKRAKLDEMSAVDTSEDWLGVGLPSLVAFERRLRCDICSELFDRPVQVNGCAHTFCETCIRGALERSSKAACPVLGCANTNIGTSKSKLVPVPALADAASTWRLARDDLMSKLRTSERRSKRKSSEPTPALAEARPSKRSRKSEPVEEIIDSDDEIEIVEPSPSLRTCSR